MCFGGKKKEEKKEEVDVEQEEQKAAAEEEKESEAEKTAEVKEKAMEAKAETFTAPVSTLSKDTVARKRQKELSTDVDPTKALENTMANVGSFLPKGDPRTTDKEIEGLFGTSRKRSKGKGRRSLITSKSGGGIGYYSRFFT
jgi:hypothetical protein